MAHPGLKSPQIRRERGGLASLQICENFFDAFRGLFLMSEIAAGIDRFDLNYSAAIE